ncbi:ankyrin [Apiospora arundinis]
MGIMLEESEPIPWNSGGFLLNLGFSNFLKLARRRYKQESLTKFVDISPCNSWSPLCRAAANGLLSLMDNLLGLGAQLDTDGCPLGSAMMAACEYGRESSVIFLARRGAALTYSSPSGFRSAYLAAQKFADILEWLLVRRFVDQAKLSATSSCLSELEERDNAGGSYAWSGPRKVELIITGAMERHPKESSFEYWIRLTREKKAWRGKVVPLVPGRRSTRSSNLVPEEYVRIHPEGYEVRRDG